MRACPKNEKSIKLTGKKLEEQNQAVYDRDNGHCVLCGKATLAPVHHIEHGTGNRSDEVDNKAVICYDCHAAYHHGNDWAQHQLAEKIYTNWGFKRVIQLFLMGYIVYVNKRDR